MKYLSGQKISNMSTSLIVRGNGASKHKSLKFVVLFLYFLDKDNDRRQVYVSLIYKIYLVNILQVNILIQNNILSLKSFVIDIKNKRALIESCGVTIPINTKSYGQFFLERLLVG